MNDRIDAGWDFRKVRKDAEAQPQPRNRYLSKIEQPYNCAGNDKKIKQLQRHLHSQSVYFTGRTRHYRREWNLDALKNWQPILRSAAAFLCSVEDSTGRAIALMSISLILICPNNRAFYRAGVIKSLSRQRGSGIYPCMGLGDRQNYTL